MTPLARSRPARLPGITYRASGHGPALVLFPLMLAPSQWEPLLAMLGRDHRVIVLGGAHLGPVALLAQRARVGFGNAVRAFIDEIAPRPDERVLEVGCGSGETIRMLAGHTVLPTRSWGSISTRTSCVRQPPARAPRAWPTA